MSQLTYEQIAGAIEKLPLFDKRRLLSLLLSQVGLIDEKDHKQGYEPPLIVEEVNGEKYEYLPLGKYVVAARGVCGGRPTIKYHRLDARHVLALIKSGEAPHQVASEYGIPAAAVEEVIALARQYDYETSYV
jgi:uncharacterized protein (DUF433 family)